MNDTRALLRTSLGCFALAAAFVACSDAAEDGTPTDVTDDALNNGTPITGYVGKCLDDPGDSTADSTVQQLYTCNGTDAQKWTYDTTNQTFTGPGGKCLDVRGSGTYEGVPVQLYRCNGTGAQKFKIVGETIVGIGGQCLDVTGQLTADRTPLQMWPCNGQENQKWHVGKPATSSDAGAKDSGVGAKDSGSSGSGGGGGGSTGGGALSGLAWASGAGTDDLNAFASWRGRPLDFGVTWPNRGNWNEIRNPDIYGAITGYKSFAGKLA
ncbi:MAG TPA: RICIN domain-containing protein, partial [Polyangiaceae bacterium]